MTNSPVSLLDMQHLVPKFDIAGASVVLRKATPLSQNQLAARMGVPRSYVSKIENRRSIPTIPVLERFAAAFNVPLEAFVSLAVVLGNP